MVVGLPRSGTTWMQHCLSSHPRIHIHGQLPHLPWETLYQSFSLFLEKAEESVRLNRECPTAPAHYAGCCPEQVPHLFGGFLRQYLSGHGSKTVRWGLKALGVGNSADRRREVETLWPAARWITCVRHPFSVIQSLKNTFVPEADADEWGRRWVEAVQTAAAWPRSVLFPIDQIGTWESRIRAAEDVFQCIGEVLSPEVSEFLGRFPVIHKVKEESERAFRLSDFQKEELLARNPELQKWMGKLGY